MCLSYCWGHPDSIDFVPAKLCKETIERYQAAGGITDATEELPWTIRDAITVTKCLGERYLWVDALCIIQDSNLDGTAALEKAQQVSMMDIIYGGAVLTIVAASGEHANAGLPGIRVGSRSVRQHTEVIKGNRLFTCPLYGPEEASISTWSTRGWTLQESLLYRRKLVFTEAQVYFHCRRGCFHEDTVSEVPSDDFSLRAQVSSCRGAYTGDFEISNDMHPSGSNYDGLMQAYTRRKVTRPEDTVRACQGMLNTFSTHYNRGNRWCYGLPVADLADTLCWTHAGTSPSGGVRKPGFPSWSWAGWEGQLAPRRVWAVGEWILRSDLLSLYAQDRNHVKPFHHFVGPAPMDLYDRKGRKDEPGFDNDTSVLGFWTISKQLQIDREPLNGKGGTIHHGESAVRASCNNVCFGMIRLHPAYRKQLADKLEVVALGVLEKDQRQMQLRELALCFRQCSFWLLQEGQQPQSQYTKSFGVQSQEYRGYVAL